MEYPNAPANSDPVWYCGYKPAISGSYAYITNMGTMDGPSTSDRPGTCNACGLNPVNLVTGAKYDAVQDYVNQSPFPIKLIRYYSNAGDGWHFNYDLRVVGFSHDATAQTAEAVLLREDGTYTIYTSSNANPSVNGTQWTWNPTIAPTSGVVGSLSSFAISKPVGGAVQAYALKNLRGEMETYDSDGKLTGLSNETGQTLSFSYDTKNHLSLITDSAGRWLAFDYKPASTFSSSWPDPSDPNAPPLNQSYSQWDDETDGRADAWSLPMRVYDDTGAVNYSYRSAASSDMADNRALALLQSVTYADGSQIQYLYGEAGTNAYGNYLTGIIGADGQRFATYKYTSSSYRRDVASSTHGNELRKITYDIFSKTVKDAYNNAFVYNATSPISKPTGFYSVPCPGEICGGSGAQIKTITWDIYGNPLTTKDFNNRVRTMTWDGPRALPLTIQEATGTTLARTTTFTWHATKRLPLTKVEPIRVNSVDGTRTTTWTYDTNGHLLSETVSNSINSQVRSQSWTYNTLGMVDTHTDARGKTTTYTYDTQANLLTAVNALNQTTTWSNYTYRGLPQKMTSANGLDTLITYDARDRATQIKRGTATAGYETWNISWLAINKMDRITRPDGMSYKMLYDSAHDLIEVQERSASNVLLGKRVFTLDLMGRLTKEETFDGAGTKLSTGGQTWNTLSRLASQTGAQNQSTTFTYDADGNLTGVADPLTHTQGAAVDALGRTISMVDQLNKTSTLTYDVQDNTTAAVDARGVSTGYAYNAFNDLLAIYSTDRGTFTFAVDANGNTITTTDPRGVEGTVIYDDLDRPTSITWSDDNVSGTPTGFTAGDKTVSYTWDSCTNGIGKLCAKTDWTGTTGYSYDLWGRLVGSAFVPAGESFTLSTGYSYDAYGRQDSIVYPSGKALTFAFGADGRPTTMSWAAGSLITNLHYQAMGGPVAGWTWGASGIPSTKSAVAFTYDLDSRMSHISDIEEISLLHDLDDRLTGETHQPNSDPDMLYTYDAKDRLTQANNALWSGAVNYGYDFGDNRTSKTWNTDGWQHAYASTSNRLSTTTPIVGGVAGTPVAVSFDAMGNLVSDTLRTYSYDATGRMVGAITGVATATYSVNAEGLRVRKQVSGVGATDEVVVYDDARRRIGVYQPNGSGSFTIKEELVYLPGTWRLAATVRGQVAGGADGTTYPILSDQLGTPRVVLDPSTGDRRWAWTAKEAFGLQAPNENPDSVSAGAFVFDARFPGQFLDAETGLFHNGFRDYDAKTGRYVESDPLGLGAGWNTYGYVGSGPTDAIDPLGLSIWDDFTNNVSNGISLVDQAIVDTMARHGAKPLPQGVVDFSAGAGDAASWGLTGYVNRTNGNAAFIQASCYYDAGLILGSIAGLPLGGAGGAGMTTNMVLRTAVKSRLIKLYHYTTKVAAESIEREGFRSAKGIFGSAVYATPFGPRVARPLGAASTEARLTINPASRIETTPIPGNLKVIP